MFPAPERVDIVGLPISLTSYEEILALLAAPRAGRALTVAVCNVHSVMTARKNPAVRQAIVSADVATPDGQPLVWAIRAMGENRQGRVYGPELMRRASSVTGLRHYLYGSTEATLEMLERALCELNPELRIVGKHAPPFRPVTDSELSADIDSIRSSGANVVWVGLGMPKQELWIQTVKNRLPHVALVGVGAAFDILAGRVRQAPPLIQRMGLEWAFRLAQEPGRLWRRYLWNNPAYLVLLGRQIIAHRLNGRTRRRHNRSDGGEAA